MKSYIVHKDGSFYVVAYLETSTGVYHQYAWTEKYQNALKLADLLNKDEENVDQ